jgi:predicted  nucleic acid-binding Zn-ribbon protein
MKSATELKKLHKRIELLKGQLSLTNTEINNLADKENKTKDETKHLAKSRQLQTNLIYEIRGRQLDFNELKDLVITEIVNS